MSDSAWRSNARSFLAAEVERYSDASTDAQRVMALLHTHTTLESVLRAYLSEDADLAQACEPEQMNFPQAIEALYQVRPDLVSDQERETLHACNRYRNLVSHEKHIPSKTETQNLIEATENLFENLLHEPPERTGVRDLASRAGRTLAEHTSRRKGTLPDVSSTVVSGGVGGIVLFTAVPVVLALVGIVVYCIVHFVQQHHLVPGALYGLAVGVLVDALIVVPTGEESVVVAVLGISSFVVGAVNSLLVLTVSGVATLLAPGWW